MSGDNTDRFYAYKSEHGNSGQYKILHNGKGAGILKPMELVIYQDVITGAVYVREFANFNQQMVLLS